MAHLLKKNNQFVKYYIHTAKYNYVKKTIYNYIEIEVFKEEGIDAFSLEEQVSRKQFKNKYYKEKALPL